MIEECSAILGQSPDEYTLRELVNMAKYKGKYDWHHTSAIMAMVLNVHIVRGDWVKLNAFVPDFDRQPNEESTPSSDIITDPAMKRCLKDAVSRIINGATS